MMQRIRMLLLPLAQGWAFWTILAAFAVVFLPSLARAANEVAPQPDTLSQMLTAFHDKAREWGDVAQSGALSLFRILLILDVGWMGIRMALKQASVKEIATEFIKLLLFAGFMYALVLHYADWASSIIEGLTGLAVRAGAPIAEPAAILGKAIELVATVFDNLPWSYKSLGFIICCIVICICFALIAAQVMLVKCESYIVLNAGMILLGFGGSQFTRNFATNFIRYALSVAVKLYVMQMLVYLGMDFFKNMVNTTVNVQSLLVIIGMAVVFLALVQSIPDIVSGIINGSHVSTGQAINSAVTAVSAGTIAATKGVVNATGGGVRGVSALQEAAGYANAEGATGLKKAGHMASTIYRAAKASRAPSFAQSVASNVKAQHEAFKMEQSAADSTADSSGEGK